MTMRTWIISILAITASHPALAAIPGTLSFAARLGDSVAPVQGTHAFEFRLFDSATGGTELWREIHATVEVGADGAVHATLGQMTPMDPMILDGARYLEVTVDGVKMDPRLSLASVPFAARAGVADRALSVDTTVVQSRVRDGCNSGSFIQSIAEDGSVTCGAGVAGTGDITAVFAGAGLAGGDSAGEATLSVDFGGNGSANTVARSDHTHPYLPRGANVACSGSDKVTGIDPATGNVACAQDQDVTYFAGSGLALSGNNFSVRFDSNGSSNVAVRSDDSRLSNSRSPTSGSSYYIQNQTGAQQSGGFNVSGAAIAGSIQSQGNITSPKFRVSRVFSANVTTANGLPLSGSFSSNGGSLLIMASGSGFAAAAGVIGMNISVDGSVRGTARSFTNEPSSHKAFVSTHLFITGLAAGSHTLNLDPLSGTRTDFNDFFDVAIMELPF
jgi:hypothetical protein